MRKYILFFFIFFCVLTGCTDYQAEYQKKLSEKIAVIQDKYDYVVRVCEEFTKNNDCVMYDCGDTLRYDQKRKIQSLLREEKEIIIKDTLPEFFLIHFPAIEDDLLSEDIYRLDYKPINSYVTDTIYNQRLMKRKLKEFDKHVVTPLKTSKYMLCIKDETLVMPCESWFDFNGGFIVAKAIIADLETKQNIDSFVIIAESSDSIKYNKDYGSEIYLVKDLYGNLKKRAFGMASLRLSKKLK